MSSSAIHPQMIMLWEMALPDELEDKPGDSVAVKMAKFNERQCRQCLALQRELEAEEWRMAKEAERVHKEQEAKAKRIRELEAERKQLEDETRQAQQAGGSSSQQVPALTGKAVERPNGCNVDDGGDEVMEDTPDVKTKNNTTIKTLAGDVQDLSGVLEELFEALKTATMALVSWAQNADNI
ncbi:hypothetical protein PISMIDRAFT_18136 [Pisolithus microcarpus 441]|uniref:Uncharacterized protein n=1 Tax=Pisolithus microcarpus 441 TaxID=765257 RepID=A0A0C9Y8F2_9AGAM|nr:hypothetical protein PISMIDRAFT_18136 [Pisolithus microcarpus 441]